jgi:uncharacterized protein
MGTTRHQRGQMTSRRPERAAAPREAIRTALVNGPILALFFATTFGVLAAFPLLRRAEPMQRVVLPGWLENLLPFGLLLLLAVGGVLMGFGRLRAADLGLGRRAFAQGTLTVGAVWLLLQLVAAVPEIVTGGNVSLDGRWRSPGVGPTLLWAFVMFCTTALFEEVAFRGVLYPQLVLRLRAVAVEPRMAALTAGVISQAVFAASHVPGHLLIRHMTGAQLWTELALQGVAGVLLLLLYLRTRNLWISVGLHGLANAPTPLVDGTVSWELPLLALLVSWPWLARRPEHRGLASVERRT